MFQTPIRRPDAPHAVRIALAITEFSTGGSERVAIRLANFWARSGRHVTIFCASEDGPTRRLVDARVRVRAIMPRVDPATTSRRTIGRLLANQISGQNFDVVVGPGNYHIPLLAALARALPAQERPAIVCKLSNPIVREDRRWWKQALFNAKLRRLTRGFDRLVAMSPGFEAEARHVLGHEGATCAAEPTLDHARIAGPREKASGMILCIGRLTPQKNFALALETFALMAPGYRLTILGEGEDYPALKAKAEALGIAPRVNFAGFVADVGPWLAHADALLSTSRFEGYPAALVEALAARVPVVSTRCSLALPDILLDESFGATAAAEPAALAHALTQVLQDARRPATQPLEKLVSRHNGEIAAQTWLDILDEAVASRAPAPHRVLQADSTLAPLTLEAAIG